MDIEVEDPELVRKEINGIVAEFTVTFKGHLKPGLTQEEAEQALHELLVQGVVASASKFGSMINLLHVQVGEEAEHVEVIT